MRARVRKTVLSAFALVGTGCSFGFQTPGIILDRRILAIQAEPPEVIVQPSMPAQPTIALQALVVDPNDTGAPQPIEWRLCQPDLVSGPFASVAAYDPSTERCTESSNANLITSGQSPLASLTTSFQVPQDTILEALGFVMAGLDTWAPVQVQLKVSGTADPLYGTKQMVVSSPGPGDRQPNHNPHLTALLFDNEPWEPNTPVTVTWKVCDKSQQQQIADPQGGANAMVTVCNHRVTPAFDPDQEETYQVQLLTPPANGGSSILSLKERLRFDWYTEQGSFSNEHTEDPSSVAPSNYDPISTNWIEPPRLDVPQTPFWVVVSDGRGGVSWEKRQILIQAQ
jgi:hypothetical protein